MRLSNNDCISSGRSSIHLSSQVRTERRLASLALSTASTYSFLVVMIVSMTTGDLSNILISTLVFISRHVKS